MERVAIFGRGGAGKSTLARGLGDATGLPVVELDKEFWNDHLQPLSIQEWGRRQSAMTDSPRWIMDGDLGPYDDVRPRLRRADTVVVLDKPLWLCAWRARRRGRERRDFWSWNLRWRRRSRPNLLQAIAAHATHAEVVVLRNPRSVRRWLVAVERRAGVSGHPDGVGGCQACDDER